MKMSHIGSSVWTLDPHWWCCLGRFWRYSLVGGRVSLKMGFESLKMLAISNLSSLLCACCALSASAPDTMSSAYCRVSSPWCTLPSRNIRQNKLFLFLKLPWSWRFITAAENWWTHCASYKEECVQGTRWESTHSGQEQEVGLSTATPAHSAPSTKSVENWNCLFAVFSSCGFSHYPQTATWQNAIRIQKGIGNFNLFEDPAEPPWSQQLIFILPTLSSRDWLLMLAVRQRAGTRALPQLAASYLFMNTKLTPVFLLSPFTERLCVCLGRTRHYFQSPRQGRIWRRENKRNLP